MHSRGRGMYFSVVDALLSFLLEYFNMFWGNILFSLGQQSCGVTGRIGLEIFWKLSKALRNVFA